MMPRPRAVSDAAWSATSVRIAPHGKLAENLAILQALTGQIYLVVIMARLVSLAVVTTDRD